MYSFSWQCNSDFFALGLSLLDGCVGCRILRSSFHDWLDFMVGMMKGVTVHHLLCQTLFTDTPMASSLNLTFLPANVLL